MNKNKILEKRNVKALGCLIILFGVSIFLLNYGFSQNNLKSVDKTNRSEDIFTELKISVVVSPIFIDDFVPGSDWAWAVTQTWCTGSGTEGDPYLLENLEIDGLTGNCISIQNSNAYFIIRTCTLHNGNYAILLSNVANGILIENNFYANVFGINLDLSSYNEIVGNDLYGDTSGTGINLYSSNNNMIEGNFVENHYQGIRLDTNCTENTILGNTADDNSNYGFLLLYDSDNNEVVGNIATNQKYVTGMILLESDLNNILDNTVSGNPSNGIHLSGSSDNFLSGNIIFDNQLDGIVLNSYYTSLMSNYNGINMNTIYGNLNNGIMLDNDCEGNWIWGNDIYENAMNGIDLAYSSFDRCYGNVIHDNTYIGIYVGINSAFNIFWENFFIRNGKHAADFGTNNDWDSGLIGNYWDNYTGPDANDDGIGDIPHDFGTGIDYLPIVDDTSPIITIISPNPGDMFDDAPSFDVTIDEDYLFTMWYTLDGGVTTYPFTGYSGMIDQVAWDALPDGDITITFYANDKAENIGSTEVIVLKDTQAPIIVINSPEDDEVFRENAPSFDLTVTDLSLEEISYSLDGGVTIFTADATGTIDQEAWAALPIGDVTITFYAIDEAGHLASAEVTVEKKAPTEEFFIGLDFFITSILILMFSGVAVVVIIAKIHSKKRII